MNEAIMNLILTILAAVATGAISIALAFLQSKVKSDKTNEAIARLGEAATITVGELQQTTVEAWKETGGGKLTSDQVKSLQAALLAKTKEKMDDPAIALLNAVGVDVNAAIQGYAEEAVRQINGGTLLVEEVVEG